jgi:hypothetical protein
MGLKRPDGYLKCLVLMFMGIVIYIVHRLEFKLAPCNLKFYKFIHK